MRDSFCAQALRLLSFSITDDVSHLLTVTCPELVVHWDVSRCAVYHCVLSEILSSLLFSNLAAHSRPCSTSLVHGATVPSFHATPSAQYPHLIINTVGSHSGYPPVVKPLALAVTLRPILSTIPTNIISNSGGSGGSC